MKLKELLQGCDYIDLVTGKDLRVTSNKKAVSSEQLAVSRNELTANRYTLTANSSLDIDISGVAYDSRKVKDGYLFVAMKGERHDGHDFIREAIKRGAIVIVHEKANPPESPHTPLWKRGAEGDFKGGRGGINNPSLIFIRVKNSRKALACIANNFYGMPSESLTLIGITGTNGKTTTTYILKSILESWGKDVGLIGTIQYMIKNRVYPALYTTPESLDFQSLLKDMFLSGCTHVISEVSSHALAQYRVDR
ncbi:MAG: Mur ligase family protein, partial [Nitrospirota bacterium]